MTEQKVSIVNAGSITKIILEFIISDFLYLMGQDYFKFFIFI